MIGKARGALRVLLLTGGAALAAACSTLPPVKTASELQRLWQTQQRGLEQLDRWTVSGRLGIQTARAGWHLSFRWQQGSGDYRIAMSNPLGQEAAELQGTPQGVSLLLADGRRVSAADPEELLAQQLGWRVPVRGLYYWVRGLPQPNAAETHGLDGAGRLGWLEQSGWHIVYRRYGDFSGKSLPLTIFLDNNELKLRLAIDGWILS